MRVSESQREYGLIAAGAVNASFIGRLPGKGRALGPVAGVSYRLASRIANSLRAGKAARSADELADVRLILFHAPPAQHATLIELLRGAGIDWRGKSLLFCDSGMEGAEHFRVAGASVARLRSCPIPGRMLLEGTKPSFAAGRRFVRDLNMKAIEVEPCCASGLDAAIALGTSALTTLIGHAAALLRECGLRDAEAMRLAASLFEKSARDYPHPGRSAAVASDVGPFLRELLLRRLEDPDSP